MKKTLSAALVLASALAHVPAFASEADVLRKLDQIAAKQEELAKKIDALQAELAIVKVRATQR